MLRAGAFLSTFVFWILFSALSWAQDTVNFDQFSVFADSVEKTIENNRLPDEGFANLRGNLVDWREQFLAAQDVNAVRIEGLKAQIEALGPAPAEGESEAENVAERRAELNGQLKEASAPRIAAEEAFARADALISQIDATLRARQTDAMFRLQRTPLDPSLWPGAFAELRAVVERIHDEVAENLAADTSRNEFWQRIAIAVIFLVVASVLIARGPRMIERWLARIETRSGEHGRIIYGFLVSFGGVLMAMAGVSLINAALISTGILGDLGTRAAIGINWAILASAVGRWLGGRLFPQRDAIPTPLALNESQRKAGRFYSLLLGLCAGLILLLSIINDQVEFDANHYGVINADLFLITGFVLFRLGGLIRAGGQVDKGEDQSFGDHVERLIGGTVQLLSVAGPLAAIVGLQGLARSLLVPVAPTLGLLAFLASLHFALRAAYAMARKLDADQAKQALTPVLVSFALTLASTPIFALIWGAQDSDLLEWWTHFKTGFQLGGASISPTDFLTFAIVFAIGFALTRLLQGSLRTGILPRTGLDKGGQNAIISGLGYIGITIAAMAGITAAGIDLSSFALIIGALGVGIGFGLQNIVNNFVSGIILLIERPIGEGDWVEVNGQMGIVKSISVRSTRIETFDRTDVIVPNGDLISGTVTNWTRGNSIGRITVPVGVAYGTDTRKVEAILNEIALDHPMVALNPQPAVIFQGFGADSMDFEIRAILTDINFGLATRSDINHEIARRFREEGIEIPFAQRDIWIRNAEAMPAQALQSPRSPSAPISQELSDLDAEDD